MGVAGKAAEAAAAAREPVVSGRPGWLAQHVAPRCSGRVDWPTNSQPGVSGMLGTWAYLGINVEGGAQDGRIVWLRQVAVAACRGRRVAGREACPAAVRIG